MRSGRFRRLDSLSFASAGKLHRSADPQALLWRSNLVQSNVAMGPERASMDQQHR